LFAGWKFATTLFSEYQANLEIICSLVQVNSAAKSAGKAFKNELEKMCGKTFDKFDREQGSLDG